FGSATEHKRTHVRSRACRHRINVLLRIYSGDLFRCYVGGGQSTIHQESGGGDVPGGVGGQEAGGGGDLGRLGEPAHGQVHQAAGGLLRVLGEQLLEQGGVDRAGAEGVDPNVPAGELDAELAGQGEHAALGRGVGDLRGRRAHHGHERGRVDH